MRKIGWGTIMQEATPNVIHLSSKWAPLKWNLILIKPSCSLVHTFPFRFIGFQQRFVWVLTAFRWFWYTYICTDPNHRIVVAASVQMLIGQQVLDNAYFPHCYYYGHLLSIMKIYKPEETYCYARRASLIVNSNTRLKCWPCRGTTPSDQFQAFLIEYTDTTIFASMLDVCQLKKCIKQKLSAWILLPIITKYMRPYF